MRIAVVGAGGTGGYFGGLLARAGQDVTFIARGIYRVVLWQKFLFICAFSGVTAVTRVPIGTILADPVTHALFRGTSEEVEAVARAGGIDLPADCVEQALATAAAVEPWGRGSLYHDLASGRGLELESLNGEVVRRGREHDIETPLNFAIYSALRPYVDGAPELT